MGENVTKVKIKNKKSSSASLNHSERSDFFVNKSALYLSDGTIFEGTSKGKSSRCIGEVVFNTGMTGYVESLTDPSYSNQILVFTYPLIGNYGIQLGDMESEKIQVNGVIVSELSQVTSHSKSSISLLDWLNSQNIPVLSGVDTRELTKYLRNKGTMLGGISPEAIDTKDLRLEPKFVSIASPKIYNKSKRKKIILVDCGMKENILRHFLSLNLSIKRVPFDYDYTNEDFDGVFISNGPGNPEDYVKTIETTSKVLKMDKPVFGICLGNQIMGIAAGAKTYKLLFGHRGHNQPCMETESEHPYITSQNHGYAIDEKTLPTDWEVSFRNLNDNSIEGIRHTKKPFFAVQFHPEAAPGPTDTAWLFERFYKSL